MSGGKEGCPDTDAHGALGAMTEVQWEDQRWCHNPTGFGETLENE